MKIEHLEKYSKRALIRAYLCAHSEGQSGCPAGGGEHCKMMKGCRKVTPAGGMMTYCQSTKTSPQYSLPNDAAVVRAQWKMAVAHSGPRLTDGVVLLLIKCGRT